MNHAGLDDLHICVPAEDVMHSQNADIGAVRALEGQNGGAVKYESAWVALQRKSKMCILYSVRRSGSNEKTGIKCARCIFIVKVCCKSPVHSDIVKNGRKMVGQPITGAVQAHLPRATALLWM